MCLWWLRLFRASAKKNLRNYKTREAPYYERVKSYRIEKSVGLVNLQKAEFQYSSEIENSSPACPFLARCKGKKRLLTCTKQTRVWHASLEQLRICSNKDRRKKFQRLIQQLDMLSTNQYVPTVREFTPSTKTPPLPRGSTNQHVPIPRGTLFKNQGS